MNPRFNDLADMFEIIDEPEEKVEQPSAPNSYSVWHYATAVTYAIYGFFTDTDLVNHRNLTEFNEHLIEANERLTNQINTFMYSNLSRDQILGVKIIPRILVDLYKVLMAIGTIRLLDESVPEPLINLMGLCSTFYIFSHTYWQVQYIRLNHDLELIDNREELREQRLRALMLLPDLRNAMVFLRQQEWLNASSTNARSSRNGSPPRITWITSEDSASQVGYSYLVTSREHQRLRYFLNRETFVTRDSVNELDSENLFVLDGYAFAIDELIAYANTSLHAIFRNPHQTQRGSNPDFSSQALDRLRNHSKLREYILKFEDYILKQFSHIQDKTLSELVRMLNRIHNGEFQGVEWNVARVDFIEYVSTLNRWRQQNLYAYLIEVAYVEGGSHWLSFQNALAGGNSDCVQVLQIFLWQFLVTHRPKYYSEIPENVHLMAANSNFIITVPVYANETQSRPARPASMPTALQPGQDEFLDDRQNSQSGIVVDLGFFNVNQRRQSTVRRAQAFFAPPAEVKEDSTWSWGRRFGF